MRQSQPRRQQTGGALDREFAGLSLTGRDNERCGHLRAPVIAGGASADKRFQERRCCPK
jgi:hypothetical protein